MAGAPNGYPNGFSAPNVGYGNGDPSLSLSPELLDDRYQARPGSIRPSIDPHANSFGRFHEPNPAVQYNPHPSSRTSMRTGPNYGYSNSLSRQNGVHGTLVTPFSQLSTRSNQSYSQHSSNGEQHSQYTTPYSQHREPYQQYSAQPQLITRPTNHPHRSDATQEYHAPLGHRTYSPAITTPIRNQPRPQPSYQNVNIQIKATADEASYDGFNIGQVKQLFNDWKARPYASLNIEGDTVKLIYPNPSSKGESPFALLEWAFKHTYDKNIMLTDIAKQIGFKDIALMDINNFDDIQQSQTRAASARLLTTSDEYQTHLITRTLSNILPDNKHYQRVHQPVFYLSYTSWSYPPQSCLTQNDRIFLGAAHTTIEYPDELDAINGQMQVLSDFCHLTICLLSNWDKPPRIYTHDSTTKDQIYKCAYNAYNLSCTPDPNKTLQWSDSETNVFQQCPDELRKIGRYKNLTNAAVLNHFIDCCNTSRVGERANFEFTTSDHLCRLIIFDNDFTTENLSKCTALQICQEYNGLIALSDIKQKAEQALRNERSSDSKTLKSFITVLGNIDPNAEGVKPILLFVFAKLTNQLQIISEFVPRFIPHIVASSLYSLNEKEGLNLLTDTHLIWLMQQQEYVLKIRESQLDISHFKRWAQLVADESIDSTLTISEAWLSFASAQRGKGRGTLLRADVDLLRKNTNMVPAKHHQLIPCENSCRTGLIKTPVGIIAPEYYRLHRLDRVGTSAGKCDLCDTLLFDFIYDNPETSTAKQTYIAHCVQHEMDVCDQCIPLTVYNPKQPSAQFKLASGNTLKQVLYEQDAHINKLEQDKVDSTQLYQWLTARNIHTNEYFELDVMWSFFADRYPQMIPRAIDELTKAIAPRVSPAIVYRQRSEHLSLPTPINLTNSNPRTLLGLKDLSLQTTHQHEHQINDVTSVLPVKATPVLGCPICTEPFDEDSIIMSTNCGHLFCEPCITDHIKYKESVKQLCECPICREKIEKITKSYSSFVKK